ncbi:ADYC domain-containing protein [Sorangium sp. So ce269]
MPNLVTFIGILNLAAALGGCSEQGVSSCPDSSCRVETGSARQPMGCSDWFCGRNAARVVEGEPFYWLDANPDPALRQANEALLKLVSFVDAEGRPLELQVVGDQLRGLRARTLLEGGGLRGTMLLLERNGQEDYELLIDDVSSAPFWVAPHSAVPIYHFMFRRAGGIDDWLPLCRASAGAEWRGAQGMAVIFRGDRYNERDITVETTGPRDPRFIIACAGSPLAKLHFLRHTAAGSDAEHRTTQEQRQAMLKMLTADYNGSGVPYTRDGHKLLFTDAKGWYPQPPHPRFDPSDMSEVASIEAIWTEHGAVCINTPRLADEEPTVLRRINADRAAMGMDPLIAPGCDVGRWRDLGYILSASPRACAHPMCSAGDSLAATCDPCVAEICAVDPHCCATGWDSACVDAVQSVCGSDECSPTCAHWKCATGERLAPDCDPCVARICVDDPFCCSTSWDSTCVAEVDSACGLSCR